MRQIVHTTEYYQKTIKRLRQEVKELKKKQRYLKKLLKAKIKD